MIQITIQGSGLRLNYGAECSQQCMQAGLKMAVKIIDCPTADKLVSDNPSVTFEDRDWGYA